MKKLFFLLMAVSLFVSALGVQVRPVRAEGYIEYEHTQFVWGTGIVFTFSAEGFRNKDVKNASILIGSDYYDLYCWVRKEENKILCVARGGLTEFAGQMGIIYLGGQFFYVIIPGKAGTPVEGKSLTCPEGQVPGADVTFFTSDETSETYFVPGSTDAEVQNNAESYLGEYYVSIEEIGDLYCGKEPS